MSDCTHDCNSCGGGCHFELEEGQKPRDMLKELKEFAEKCDTKEMSDLFDDLAKELDAEM